MVDADFAMVTNGDTRRLDHLKKKRLKHLTACPEAAPQLIEMYQAGTLRDSDVRSVLFPIMEKNGAHAPESNREG